jgi:hypothetical protein
VAACLSCQEHAAVAPGDSFLQLVCRVHARTGRQAETVTEVAQGPTPEPLAAVAAQTDTIAPAVLPAVTAPTPPAEAKHPETLPPELARPEWADAAEFTRVLAEALRHLEPQAQDDRVGWQQLVKTMLYWGLFRRPPSEHAQILASVRGCMANAELQREVETMAGQMEQTWEQELLARGEARGIALGEARGVAIGEARGELNYCRKMVRKALERRFNPLPEEVLQRIANAELPALEAVLDRADTIQSLDELGL